MTWLNYHHLFYFWTVAKTGSIAAAAERLRLAQPTLSTQVRQLEASLGHKLFERAGRGLKLTEMGRTVFRYADEIFALGEELTETVEGRSPGAARFTVGVTDVLPKPLAYRFLEPALRLEGVRTVCFEGKAPEMFGRLAVHEIDLVLSDFAVGAEYSIRAFSRLLGRSDVSVFGARAVAEPLAAGFPGSLDGAPFLLPTENTALRRALDQWFAASGVRPRIVAEFEDSELLKEYGQAGGGLFAVPSVSDEHTVGHYGALKLGVLPDVQASYYAITTERRLKNPAVAAIVESAQREIFG